METRQQYLVKFLRGCAQAADNGELGVQQGKLLLNGDLMREAAAEFERMLSDKEGFKSYSDKLRYNIVRAEQYARQAHDLMYESGAPRRSIWFKTALGRAQSILMSLHVQELNRKEKDDGEIPRKDNPSGPTTSW